MERTYQIWRNFRRQMTMCRPLAVVVGCLFLKPHFGHLPVSHRHPEITCFCATVSFEHEIQTIMSVVFMILHALVRPYWKHFVMLFGSKDLSARKCRFNWWLEILSEGDQAVTKQIAYQNECWQRSVEHRSILVPFLWLFMISCVELLLLQQFCCPLLGGNWRFVGVWWAFTWFHFLPCAVYSEKP